MEPKEKEKSHMNKKEKVRNPIHSNEDPKPTLDTGNYVKSDETVWFYMVV